MIGFGGGSLHSAMFVAFAMVAGSSITLCRGDGGGGSGSSPAPIVPAGTAAAAALAELWRKLDHKTKLGRHRMWFALRRAEKAAAEHSDWVTEEGQLKIIQHVEAELAAVEAYANTKIGQPAAPGTLFAPQLQPPHLDLEDAAKVRVDTKAAEIKTRTNTYRNLRWERSHAIVWRAAALEPAVWKAGSPATIDNTVLDYMLDRRLRAIERMEVNVNAGIELPSKWKIAGPAGPWKDGFRVRMFEYGSLPRPTFDWVMPLPDFKAADSSWWHPAPHVRSSLNPSSDAISRAHTSCGFVSSPEPIRRTRSGGRCSRPTRTF